MKRITQKQAEKLLQQDKSIIIVPCKFSPEPGNFSLAMTITKGSISEQLSYNPAATWKEKFSAFLNNYRFYNCSYETGYYPHYYQE